MKQISEKPSILELVGQGKSWFTIFRHIPHIGGDSLFLVIASFCINLTALALPIALMQVYDRIIPNEAWSTLAWLTVGIITASILETVLRILRSRLSNWISARFEHILSTDALNHLIYSRLDEYDSAGTGVHMERLNAVGTLKSYYSGQLFQLFLDLPFALLFLLIEWYIGGAIVFFTVALILLFLGITAFCKRKYEYYRHLQQNVSDQHFNFLMETLGGIHTVKSMTMEEQMLRRYESIQAGLSGILLRQNRWNSMPGLVGTVITQLNMLGIIAIGAAAVIHGSITVGIMTACTMLAARAMAPIQQIAGFWIRQAEADLARKQLHDIAEMTQDIIEEELHSDDIEGRVTLEEVTLEHKNYPEFKQLSMTFNAGEYVAVTGPNDEETTTLMFLICGIIKPTSGKILIDEYNISRWDHSHFGGRVEYIPRSAQLFKGTILENITLFNPVLGSIALDTASLMGIDDMVADLPQGYETAVEGGIHQSLPNGLIQRIMIARALVVRPRILILDRTLYALDPESLERVTEIIHNLRGTCTIIMVSDHDRFAGTPDRIIKVQDSHVWEEVQNV